MRAPKFIPKTTRPWNPALREVWDAMSDNEKRWSTIIDIAVCAVVLGLFHTLT